MKSRNGQTRKRNSVTRPKFLPSHIQIEKMCRIIQDGWSEREIEQRAVGPGMSGWTVPEVKYMETSENDL